MSTPLRGRYPEYFPKSAESLSALLRESLLVFDASVLLNFYQLSAKSRDNLRSVLLPAKARMWLVDQTVLEYSRNRPGIVRKQLRAEADIGNELEKCILELIAGWRTKFGEHPSAPLTEIGQRLKAAVDEVREMLSKPSGQRLSMETDHVLSLIEELFENRIADGYSEAKLEEVYKEGQKRYANEVPPGFCDAKKGGSRQYGDYVFWCQVMDLAKTQQRSAIVVIDDRKQDWWLKDGDQTMGPRPELRAEMRQIARQDVHLYDTDAVIKHLGELHGTAPTPELTQEVRALKEEEAKRDRWTVTGDFARAVALLAQQNAEQVEQFRESINQMSEVFNAIHQPAILQIAENIANAKRLYDLQFRGVAEAMAMLPDLFPGTPPRARLSPSRDTPHKAPPDSDPTNDEEE